ncbi:T9SS type A sorting domain-containing protein, partial [candidate division KSB1 bacterium]|nr:T9SS type A sorting domain-containing protein [candidate division KSB1 bacterium]
AIQGSINPGARGSVLRWVGTPAAPFTPFNPATDTFFGFQFVGDLPDGQGAELAYHQGRLFVGTWPEPIGASYAGIYMSPDFSVPGYLDNTHRPLWTKVWQVPDYEPDPVIGLTYGVGAMASFDGYLYWGTMHVPMSSLMAYDLAYGIPPIPDTTGMSDSEKDSTMVDAYLRTFLGTIRATSLLRGTDFHLGPPTTQVNLLYGMPVFTVYDPVNGWITTGNNMGVAPMYGLSGYWNFFNNYTWSMAVYNGQLYIGTMDWSYILKDYVLFFLKVILGFEWPFELRLPKHFYGADIIRIPNSASPGFYENINGIGNYTNYGARNMVSNDALYLGMANPMNLLTDLTDTKPEGGWELIGMYANQPDTDGDGMLDIMEGTGDRDGDTIPNDQDYDPTGFLYDEATGYILPTGRIDVVPMLGNGSVTMIENGSSGYYQFLIDGLDYYQLVVTPPQGWMLSTTCLPSFPPLDPTGMPDPVVLGNGRNGVTDTLTSNACTPYYLVLNLGNGDPNVINNNIPLQPNPISITLVSLNAYHRENGNVIEWKTETETNTAGFNIYKSKDGKTGLVRLNDELIPAKGTSTTGASYSFTDVNVSPGVSYYHLEDINLNGGSEMHNPVSVMVNLTPAEYSLEQNYPNPLNPATTIQYTLPQSSSVRIVVYDASGRLVRHLVSGVKDSGTHFVEWGRRDDEGKRVSSGVYFYRMSAGSFEKTCKMVVLN